MWWRYTRPRSFSKKSKLSIYLFQQYESLYSFFLLYVQFEDCQELLKLRCCPLAFTKYTVFLEKQSGLELVLLPHFLYDIWRKIFFTLYSINWPNFIFLITFTSWDIEQYVYCNCLVPSWWCHKFWN